MRYVIEENSCTFHLVSKPAFASVPGGPGVTLHQLRTIRGQPVGAASIAMESDNVVAVELEQWFVG
ncbi:MAG: hypothetical protein IT444_02965 [Phycisphaeraceae bacterium]|nr:hypothetical protein [Phycisphaeraceae bacterium]